MLFKFCQSKTKFVIYFPGHFCTPTFKLRLVKVVKQRRGHAPIVDGFPCISTCYDQILLGTGHRNAPLNFVGYRLSKCRNAPHGCRSFFQVSQCSMPPTVVDGFPGHRNTLCKTLLGKGYQSAYWTRPYSNELRQISSGKGCQTVSWTHPLAICLIHFLLEYAGIWS